MKDRHIDPKRRHSWFTCSAALPHRSIEDVRQTVFLMPAMHLIIPLPVTTAEDHSTAYMNAGTEDPEPSAAAMYEWAASVSADNLMLWREGSANPPLTRCQFISSDSETL